MLCRLCVSRHIEIVYENSPSLSARMSNHCIEEQRTDFVRHQPLLVLVVGYFFKTRCSGEIRDSIGYLGIRESFLRKYLWGLFTETLSCSMKI